jgi:putative transposase
VPRRTRRRKKAPRTPGSVTATRPDQVWALDFLFDQTADGRPIKILNVTDEYTREALACVAARTGQRRPDRRRPRQPRLPAGTGATAHPLRQRPELVAETLRDWCRFSGTSRSYIEPGAPWQNPYVESFNGHLRRELLELESFNSLYEAQILLEDWRHEYNNYRPHQSLSYQTPAAFAHHWHAHHQPAHS